jgi:hypothetical protein
MAGPPENPERQDARFPVRSLTSSDRVDRGTSPTPNTPVSWGPGGRELDRKIAEGKTSKEAIRALKRRLSDVVYRHLVADARNQH